MASDLHQSGASQACRLSANHRTEIVMTQDDRDQKETKALKGCYANYFELGYNEFEFVLDFGQYYQNEKVQLHSRIVLLPSYAKNLAELLQGSIESYEGAFGGIATVGE